MMMMMQEDDAEEQNTSKKLKKTQGIQFKKKEGNMHYLTDLWQRSIIMTTFISNVLYFCLLFKVSSSLHSDAEDNNRGQRLHTTRQTTKGASVVSQQAAEVDRITIRIPLLVSQWEMYNVDFEFETRTITKSILKAHDPGERKNPANITCALVCH